MILADITVEEWLTAAGILVGAVIVATVVGRIVTAVLHRRMAGASLSGSFLTRLVRWTILLIGLVYAAGEIGVEIGPLIGALGITGLAVALALQPVLQNLFAGVVLQTERPIDCGEEIETMDHHGLVLDVTSRATVVQTFDGAVVHIPNSAVLDGAITNHTRNGVRRSIVVVGVAYATDVEHACQVLATAAASVDGVYESPAPEALASEFSASSIDIEVEYWHDPHEADRRALRSTMVATLREALRDAEIEIPFPQRDLWVRDRGDGA